MASLWTTSKFRSVCLISFLLSSLAFSDTLHVPDDYSTIQSAIDAADPNDTIIVSPGTYMENINFNGKNIVLTSTVPNDPEVVDDTVINAGGRGSVVTFSGSETHDCVLQGFCITNGFTNSSGGGIRGHGTEATIINCVIENNTAQQGGGGLYACDGAIIDCIISANQWSGLYDCDGPITHCTISGNTEGGGLDGCDGTISDCTVADNIRSGLQNCHGTIINCTVKNNIDYFGIGGGLKNCHATIRNCLVVGNAGNCGGGFVYCDGCIMNCTVTGNGNTGHWTNPSSGFYQCEGIIRNCISWGNYGYSIYKSSVPSYSCIEFWNDGGTGNINSDPLFADAENGDFHLKSQYGRWDPNMLQWVYDAVTSSCLDTGDPASDWTAELWPHGSSINMGAYGGTAEASMSLNLIHPFGNVADLNHDDEVSLIDLILISEDWLYEKYLLDTDLNRNGRVDMADLSEFCAQWLWQQE